MREYLEYYDNRPYLGKQNIDDNLQDENEYQRAANILTKHIEESGLELPSNDEAVEQCRAGFIERYSPEKLAALSDEEVLQYIFYSSGDNSDALCYWIERNTQCREFFGSIAGGSAYKFGLFQKKDTGVWTSGSANNSKELSDEEALQLGKSIRDALVNGSKLISEANPQTIEDYEKMATKLSIGEITLHDIVHELRRPGRDPREDMPKPVLRTDVLEMKDLKPGMILKGTVRNVIDFGVFVDIGVHQDGLVHISQLTNKKFVRHPMEMVSVGDVVEVKVMSVDLAKKRIQLTMILD